MISGLLAKKLGMTQVFTEDGRFVPVTVLQAGPCTVLQVRTKEKDGYQAVQLGFEDKKRNRAKQCETGQAKKADTEPKKFVREVAWDGEDEPELGQGVDVSVFEGVDSVDVTGTTKGRGFAGVVKRYHFAGGPATHGQKDRHRAAGAIGQASDPARVFKGTRMAGRMGSAKHTTQNLEVVKIDPETNTLAVKGAVSGHNKSYVIVNRSLSVRKKAATK